MKARALVEGQRNALVTQIRNRLSPWGRIYSTILKPSGNLPTLDQLVARKGSVEAVMVSVGKSRSAVNRFAATLRVAGPAAVVIQITLSAVIIAEARPEERGRVTAGQGGAITGGALGGADGARWVGAMVGERAGTFAYDLIARFLWTRGSRASSTGSTERSFVTFDRER